jgi:predicted outer membrane protein
MKRRHTNLKHIAIGAIVLTSTLSVTPLAVAQTEAASTTAANPLAQADKDFVQAASMSSSTEIDAAKLATANSEEG